MQVCKLHFSPSEIIRTTSAFDDKYRKTIACILKIPKLSFAAVPSVFPNCLAYLSQSSSIKRNSRENLLMMKECQNIKRAIEKRAKEFEEQIAKDRFISLIELTEKLKIEPPWKVVELSNKLNICYIEDSASTGPHIKAALCIREDMLLDVFIQSVKLPRLGKLQLPVTIK